MLVEGLCPQTNGESMAAIATSLGAKFAGIVITSDDDRYDEARAICNGTVDARPALIARCRTADDIVAAVTPAAARPCGRRARVPDGPRRYSTPARVSAVPVRRCPRPPSLPDQSAAWAAQLPAPAAPPRVIFAHPGWCSISGSLMPAQYRRSPGARWAPRWPVGRRAAPSDARIHRAWPASARGSHAAPRACPARAAEQPIPRQPRRLPRRYQYGR